MLSRRLSTVGLNLLVLVGVLLTAIPYLYMISASVRPQTELYQIPISLFPREFTWNNYITLFENTDYLIWYRNTIVTAVIRTVLSVYLSGLAGYAFAKFTFRFKQPLFFLVLATLTLPFHILLIPLFILMVNFGWINTYLPIIIPGLVGAFNIFLLKQYIEAVPDELLDAARIDGASEISIYNRLILPLIRPGLAVVATLSFVGTWNDYLWPLIVLNDSKKYLLAIGIATMNDPYDIEIGTTMAAAFLSTLPIVIVFLLLQRHIIAGLTRGAIRG